MEHPAFTILLNCCPSNGIQNNVFNFEIRPKVCKIPNWKAKKMLKFFIAVLIQIFFFPICSLYQFQLTIYERTNQLIRFYLIVERCLCVTFWYRKNRQQQNNCLFIAYSLQLQFEPSIIWFAYAKTHTKKRFNSTMITNTLPKNIYSITKREKVWHSFVFYFNFIVHVIFCFEHSTLNQYYINIQFNFKTNIEMILFFWNRKLIDLMDWNPKINFQLKVLHFSSILDNKMREQSNAYFIVTKMQLNKITRNNKVDFAIK